MSFDNASNLRTIRGFDVLKYAQEMYDGIDGFKIGFDYKFDKNYYDGDWKLMRPIDKHIERKIF